MFSGFEFPRVEVRLALEVPAGTRIRIGTTSGDIETERLSGAQYLTTTSGDVTVHDAGGRLEVSSTSGDVAVIGLESLRARTASGDIQVEGARGLLDVHSTSGEIQVSGVADSLLAKSVSGDIRADGAARRVSAETTSGEIAVGSAAGVVRAETTSGDIRLDLSGPLDRADIDTASGSIVIGLDPALGCELDVRTSSGALDVDVPMRVRTLSRTAVLGVVHDGAARVRLRSVSGDIAVRRGGD
jgi:DUF4097 and DUF4098 domain-containing protein YvlB